MKKTFSLTTLILAVLFTATITVNLTTYLTGKQLSYSGEKTDIPNISGGSTAESKPDLQALLSEVIELTDKYYINDIDYENLEKCLMYGYLLGIEDKYAAYMTESEFNAFQYESEGHFVGIGVNIIYDTEKAGMYIINVHDGVPAKEAGLVPGDIITHVDGQAITELGYYGAIDYIKTGKEGEPVILTIVSSSDYSAPKDVEVKRAVVNTVTVSDRMVDDSIAVISISEFNAGTPLEFIQALKNSAENGADRFIFDVRNNPGGELNAITTILDMLLPEGPMIRISDKNSEESAIYSDAAELDAPMVVITNQSTVSAAELFTSALRDYKKADIVGSKTYGKGTVVSTIPLKNGGGLSISTKLYCPPFGENYEGIGIEPDYEVNLTDEEAKNFYFLTDDKDPQLQKAIEIIKAK